MTEQQAAARARLRAFLVDIQAACAKHGCIIDDAGDYGIALEIAGAGEMRLFVADITATSANDALWRWSQEEQRIAGPPVDRRFAYAAGPDLPEGTPYTATVWKDEPL